MSIFLENIFLILLETNFMSLPTVSEANDAVIKRMQRQEEQAKRQIKDCLDNIKNEILLGNSSARCDLITDPYRVKRALEDKGYRQVGFRVEWSFKLPASDPIV